MTRAAGGARIAGLAAASLLAAAVLVLWAAGALYVVGETVEHFTVGPTTDQLRGCATQQLPDGGCP